jgi:predicted permease
MPAPQPPSVPPRAPGTPGDSSIVQPLAFTLAQCFAIVAVGYTCRRTRVFSKSDVEGISGFVARIALPVLILLHTATLDLSTLSETSRLIAAVLVGKLSLFLIVVSITGVTAFAADTAYDRRADTGATDPGTERLHTTQGAERSINSTQQQQQQQQQQQPQMSRPAGRAWMRRAGLNAIFATQTNDFALGLPLFSAIWGDQYTSTIFVVGVVQLGVLNPLAFILMEAGNGGRGYGVLRKVLRSPVVMASVAGLVLRLALAMAGAALPELVHDTLQSLGDTFTGTALLTLGLSLRARPDELRERRVAALCLLTSKVGRRPTAFAQLTACKARMRRLPSADERERSCARPCLLSCSSRRRSGC